MSPQGAFALLLQEIFHSRYQTRGCRDGSAQVRHPLCKQEGLGLDICDPGGTTAEVGMAGVGGMGVGGAEQNQEDLGLTGPPG